MSDTKISEFLSETMSIILKKPEISNKINKLYLSLVFPVVSIVLFGIYTFKTLTDQYNQNREDNINYNDFNKAAISNLNYKIDVLNEKITHLEKIIERKFETQELLFKTISNSQINNYDFNEEYIDNKIAETNESESKESDNIVIIQSINDENNLYDLKPINNNMSYTDFKWIFGK